MNLRCSNEIISFLLTKKIASGLMDRPQETLKALIAVAEGFLLSLCGQAIKTESVKFPQKMQSGSLK